MSFLYTFHGTNFLCLPSHSYVLGLGDRHPSNLMLDRKTGKVLHIDFGDCFEVAMQREKFPEKVPFRLTRMLVNAMEVAGIEGNYRSTCENVSASVSVFDCACIVFSKFIVTAIFTIRCPTLVYLSLK